MYEGGHYKHNTNTMAISPYSDLSCNTNTVSHELRHKKQDEYADRFWKQLWYKLTNNKKFNKNEFKLAVHFKFERFKYNALPHNHLAQETSTSYKLYRNNGLEVDAHNQGYRYEMDYLRKTKEFSNNFPYISKHNCGAVGSGLKNGKV